MTATSAPEVELWKAVDTVLCNHESVVLRFGPEGQRWDMWGPGRIGCTCGAFVLPADPDDLIPGGWAWRRHRAERVLEVLAEVSRGPVPAEIRARLEAATPGPWRYNPAKVWHSPEDLPLRRNGEEYVAAGPLDAPVCVAATGPADHPQSMADARFIAHVRQDVVDLLARIALLQEAEVQRAELQAVFDLQWTRTREATARWQAEAPEERSHVWPDLGELLKWLMTDRDRWVGIAAHEQVVHLANAAKLTTALAERDEAQREVAVLAETNRRMNEGWANAEAAVQRETRQQAIDALRDRERWAKWCAERIVADGMQTVDVRQPTDAADYLAALGDDAPPPNDIEATGHCCCNGCVGEGPCDLDPRPDLSELDEDFRDEHEEVDRG